MRYLLLKKITRIQYVCQWLFVLIFKSEMYNISIPREQFTEKRKGKMHHEEEKNVVLCIGDRCYDLEHCLLYCDHA